MELYTFKWPDYLLFIFMLVLSALIGVYFGFIKKQNTPADYLLGGKQMTIWPVSMSMITSQLSGLVVISFSADIYRYGITFWLIVPIMTCVTLTVYYVYLPVFYKLNITSIYEYLCLRFDNKVRIFASTLFTIQKLLALPIIIYVPALALTQVTGINIHFITPVVCGVCIFYTTIGGMKAIVRADALQFTIFMGTLTLVLAIGTWTTGGISSIFRRAYDGNRLNISFDLSLIKRDTFWSGTVASYFMFLNHYGCNQLFIQKCLSLSSYQSIKSALIITTIGIMLIKSFCMFTGLIMFAKYYNCDPVVQGILKSHDQLLPMYVTEEIQFVPGLSGLFLSGIFSASLSTLAAGLNCLSATIYVDFICPFIPKTTCQQRKSLYLKLLVAFLGIFSTVSVLVIEKLGNLFQLVFSFGGITAGPLLGLFSAGMLFPMINSKGALYGGIIAFTINTWLVVGGLWYKMQGAITYPILSVCTNGCNETTVYNHNKACTSSNIANNHEHPEESLFILYRISFYWYVMIGAFMVLLPGIIISYFTKKNKPLNKDCISPIVSFLLTPDVDKCSYNTIEKTLYNMQMELVSENMN